MKKKQPGEVPVRVAAAHRVGVAGARGRAPAGGRARRVHHHGGPPPARRAAGLRPPRPRGAGRPGQYILRLYSHA